MSSVSDLLITTNAPSKQLLLVVEVGGSPDFSLLYSRLGYAVKPVRSVRKAIKLLKKRHFDAIIVEFNQPTSNFFVRNPISNVEMLLAKLKSQSAIKVIVFYETEYNEQISQLQQRFPYLSALTYPVDSNQLEAKLVDYIN